MIMSIILFMQKIESFDARFGGFREKVARLVDSDSSSQGATGSSAGGGLEDSADFDYPCQMALRLRASQKQVLWEVMSITMEPDGVDKVIWIERLHVVDFIEKLKSCMV
jgi:hypothetical protein